MDVFLSWSGPPSHKAALLFKGFLQSVIQTTDVWVSSASIASGTQWASELKTALAEIDFGVSMVTKANVNNPYLLFEAGAISKKAEGRLVPVLCDLRLIDLKGPLSTFQAREMNSEDIW